MKMKWSTGLLLSLALALVLVTGSISCLAEADPGPADQSAADEKYTLEQVVIVSRHNLRAPLSSNGSVPSELTPDNPPMKYDLTFEGVETNGDGLISEADFFALLDRAIEAFDALEATYAPADAA